MTVEQVKATYDAFETFLLGKGQMLARDTGVGYWGVTNVKDLHELFEKVKLHEHEHLLDLGSGDGRVAAVASLHGIQATGVEFDEWLHSCATKIVAKLPEEHSQRVTLKNEDFMHMDLAPYDVIYVSPDKPFSRGLEKKLKEAKGKVIVHSYEFQPRNMHKIEEHVINGDLFCVYKNKE